MISFTGYRATPGRQLRQLPGRLGDLSAAGTGHHANRHCLRNAPSTRAVSTQQAAIRRFGRPKIVDPDQFGPDQFGPDQFGQVVGALTATGISI